MKRKRWEKEDNLTIVEKRNSEPTASIGREGKKVSHFCNVCPEKKKRAELMVFSFFGGGIQQFFPAQKIRRRGGEISPRPCLPQKKRKRKNGKGPLVCYAKKIQMDESFDVKAKEGSGKKRFFCS